MAGFDPTYAMVHEDEVNRFMQDFKDELRRYSHDGLASDMQEILRLIHESHDKYVPEDTQATKKSWFQEIKIEDGEVTAVFGNDKDGELEYVPFIYLGYDMEGNPINFRKAGAIPMWLEQAFHDNLDEIERILTKPKKRKK